MRYYAEFFNRLEDKYSACGDRSVLRLDGRVRAELMREWARDWARKHNFEAYQLIRGGSLLSAKPITSRQQVPN